MFLKNMACGSPPARLGLARLVSARLCSPRLGSARPGPARLGSARLVSGRLGSARPPNLVFGGWFVDCVVVVSIKAFHRWFSHDDSYPTVGAHKKWSAGVFCGRRRHFSIYLLFLFVAFIYVTSRWRNRM